MLQANYYEPCGLPYHNDQAVFDLISPETKDLFYYCTNCEVEVEFKLYLGFVGWIERKTDH